MTDSKGETLWQRWQELKRGRQNFEAIFQDIVDLVRPIAGDFNRQSYPGISVTRYIHA